MKPFGINVVVIEPGGIRTEWAGIAADHLRTSSGTGAYAEQAEAMVAMLGADRRDSPPSVIANVIGKAVTARHPKTRYVAGFGGRPLLLTRRVLPDRTFDALIARVTGVPSRSPRQVVQRQHVRRCGPVRRRLPRSGRSGVD